MKTTIIIEDGPSRISQTESTAPAAAESPARDAGAAPGDGSPSSDGSANDAGGPPSWLLDAISAAGGRETPTVQTFHAGAARSN
jgi:hypothetical protein